MDDVRRRLIGELADSDLKRSPIRRAW